MKVKDLIASLELFDPELEVQCFHDIGAIEIDAPTLYKGLFEYSDNKKLIRKTKYGKFVGIGNPADFEIDDDDLPEIIL